MKCWLILFCLFFIKMGMTQDVEVKWSEIVEIKKGEYINASVVKHDSTGIYILRTEINSKMKKAYHDRDYSNCQGYEVVPVMDVFNENLERIESYHVLNENDRRNWAYIGRFLINKELYFRVKAYDTCDSSSIFLAKFNFETQQLDSDSIVLQPKRFMAKNLHLIRWSSIVTVMQDVASMAVMSPDSSKIMFYNYDRDLTKRNTLSLKVFDKNMNFLWEKSGKLPVAANTFELVSITFTKREKTVILAKVYDDIQPEGKFNTTHKFTYVLLTINKNEEEVNVIPIDIDHAYKTEIKVTSDPAGNVIYTGLFGDEKKHLSSGMFFKRLVHNEAGYISDTEALFKPSFLKNFMSERAAEKKRPLESLRINDIKQFKNGSVLLFCERVKQPSSTINYEDIILIKLNMKGEIEWGKKVEKKQVGEARNDYDILSFEPIIHQDKVLFFYNTGNSEGHTFKIKSTAKDSKNPYIEEKILLELEHEKPIPIPNSMVDLGNNTYIICAESRNNSSYRLGKITIKN